MQANDAIRILGSAAAMGLLGGGSALAYNAISQPTLDEYGNVIESNDINPIAAALGGAVGAVGGYGYGKYNQPVAKPVQGMNRPQRPQVQIVPANPMEIQSPYSAPGMKTVVVQPIKEPGQEMMEEALRLRELASRQGNPSVPYDVFGEDDGYWEAQKKRA